MSENIEPIPGRPGDPVGTCLKLDQSTVQHVINGAPQFDEGITVKADKYIFLDGT